MSSFRQDCKVRVKIMTNEIINEIQKQIQDERISIATKRFDTSSLLKKSSTKKFPLRNPFNESCPLQQLQQLKKSKLLELNEIERQENILKKSKIFSKSSKHKSLSKLQRSMLTKEQAKKIKRILKKQRLFQRKLKEKQAQLETMMAQKLLQEKKSRDDYYSQQCQQRKKQILVQRQQMKVKREKRQLLLEEQIKRLDDLKLEHQLYYNMTERWREEEKALQEEKKRAWEQQNQKRKIDSKAIEHHQRNYLQSKKQREAQREKCLEQVRLAGKESLPYIRNKIFYQIQKEEEERRSMDNVRREQIENNINKKKIFSRQVKETILPKLKTLPRQQTARTDTENLVKISLGTEEVYKLGNDYMKIAHKNVTKDLISKQKQSKEMIKEQVGGHKSHYKNYLKDLTNVSQRDRANNSAQDLSKTLHDSKLSEYDRLIKLKQLISSKENGKKYKQHQNLIETIKNKMVVLKELIK